MPLPELGIIGYFLGLVVLVVFGIWGFRLGSNGPHGGNRGGGSKRPHVQPPPPSGGHEVTDDFQAWEKQFEEETEHEPAARGE
jgi:hypothetical protein